MKIVITGGPCSGKSTIISELKNRGFKIIDETAREVINDRNLDSNMTRDDSISIQHEIILRQIEKEKVIDGSFEIYFLDRGIFDVYAYYLHLTGRIPEDMPFVESEKYAAVFALEPIKFVKDNARREDDAEALEIHEKILEAYIAQGYTLINVPVMDVEKRAGYILSVVDDLKKEF